MEDDQEGEDNFSLSKMNREGHIIWSEFILIIGMGGFLLYLLNDYGLRSVSVAIICSIATYLLGAIAPDFDHPKVHKIKLMAKYTKHRGHFHSIVAMCVYGVLLFPIFFFTIHYWWAPVLVGMFGFFTHLLLDEIKNLKTNGARAIKLW